MKKNLKVILLFLIPLFFSCDSKSKSDTSIPHNPHSIFEHLSNNNLDRHQKIEILNDAYRTSSKMKSDSLKNSLLVEISYQYLKYEDSLEFLRVNKEANELSITLKDSSAIAATFWDLGDYYDAKNKVDSAYFNYHSAQKIYEANRDNFNSARLLLTMAIIQKNIKDYTGSEVTTVQAISLLKPLQKHKQLYSAYNNLGIIFNELEEFDRAIFYHEIAWEHLIKSESPELIPLALNNMGVVYSNQKNYKDAIQNFQQGLEHKNLYQSNPKLYAMLLDNLTYAKFKSKDAAAELPDLFYKALKIRDSLQISSGITTSKLHLAEYFLDKKDTLKGIEYARQAKQLSSQSNNYKDFLSSLLILLSAEKDSALAYSQEYIRVNDSLQKGERAIRNKFARIRFETDEYISETERLNQRVIRISIIAIGLILISVLLYIIKDQWSRNKLIKQKKAANQEIYNLILEQQRNFEEGREKEKQHISRELHDGILGKLLGVRLSLDSLNEEDTPAIKKKRFNYIEEIQNIAEEIRLISHRLNKVSLVDVDFKTVLEELIEKQNRGKIKFRLDVNPSIKWDSIDDDIKINFYRIIQEAINNIHKHSESTEALVQFAKIGNQLILKISDNGKGMGQMHTNWGIGLKNMKVRAKNIGGDLEIIQGNYRTQGSLIKLTVKL